MLPPEEEANLQCVFDAFAVGDPFTFTLVASNSYVFVGEALAKTIMPLGAGAWLVDARYDYQNDVGGQMAWRSVAAFEELDGPGTVCGAMEAPIQRWKCLFELAFVREACTDPDSVRCVAGP